jgi:hypothetical protein
VSGVEKKCLSLHPTPDTLLPVFFAPLREMFFAFFRGRLCEYPCVILSPFVNRLIKRLLKTMLIKEFFRRAFMKAERVL